MRNLWSDSFVFDSAVPFRYSLVSLILIYIILSYYIIARTTYPLYRNLNFSETQQNPSSNPQPEISIHSRWKSWKLECLETIKCLPSTYSFVRDVFKQNHGRAEVGRGGHSVQLKTGPTRPGCSGHLLVRFFNVSKNSSPNNIPKHTCNSALKGCLKTKTCNFISKNAKKSVS